MTASGGKADIDEPLLTDLGFMSTRPSLEAWVGVVLWIAIAAVVAGSLTALWRLRK